MSARSTPFVAASETCASNPSVEARRDRDNPREHSDAEPAPYPFACPKRSFHGGEDLTADQQGNGKGRRGARGIGKKQGMLCQGWHRSGPHLSAAARE